MKASKELKGIKLAVVTNSPSVIVFPMLIDSDEKALNINPFATLGAAEFWILNGV